MTAVQRLVSNGNSIINFLKNFSSATAQDVSVDWVNDDDTVDTKTFANIKKFQDSLGMTNDGGVVKDLDGTIVGGRILQVITTTIDTKVGVNTSSFIEPSSDFRLSITPKKSNSKLLITFNFNCNFADSYFHQRMFKIKEINSGVDVSIGSADGDRNRVTQSYRGAYDSNAVMQILLQGIYSVTSTDELTFGFEMRGDGNDDTNTYFNHTSNDGTSYQTSTPMIITIMEVAQ